jgi:hypothetical protein
MSALTGTQIKNTYQSLLKLINNGSLQTSTPIIVSDGLGNATPLQLSETRIMTQYSALNNGLSLDFIGNTFSIGDYDFNSNGTVLQVNVPSELIKTTHSFLDKGLRVNFADKVYALGDYNSYDNGTNVFIDDTNQEITIKANSELRFTGAGLEATGAGGNSGKHLVIVLNGNPYKITLLDP